MTTPIAHDDVRTLVRDRYGDIASGKSTLGCCNPGGSGSVGYSEAEQCAVPEGTDLGLGCGNPHAIAALKPGQTVLDLGSGAGFDCFLAARAVGPTGKVIGVDMTPAMISRARKAAAETGVTNVEFRLGEIEHLPVSEGTVDVILSNCVVNLSPDKASVFREARRVLAPGGRIAISDVVQLRPLPPELQSNVEALVACAAGAATVADIEAWLAEAGLVDIRVTIKTEVKEAIASWMPGSGIEEYVASAIIEARAPGGAPLDAPKASSSCCAPSCCN